MKQYYIGCRCSFSEMEKVVGNKVSRLNQKMSERIRRVAMDMGIKKNTKDGGRLEFYLVDEDAFNNLTLPSMMTYVALKADTDYRPLVAVDRELMATAIETINAQYGHQGMDYKTYNKYNADLTKAVMSSVVKIQDDKVAERKQQPKLGPNPYNVGDLLTYERWKYRDGWENHANTRVARATSAYVWLEVLTTIHGPWYNTQTAVEHFLNVKHYGNLDDQTWTEHGHFIPLKHNPTNLVWQPVLKKYRWDKLIRWTKSSAGKDHTGVDNKAEVGVCYHHEPNYN
jgi:hypothetical protein